MAKTIDLLLANRQQMAKNFPDDEVDFLEKKWEAMVTRGNPW